MSPGQLTQYGLFNVSNLQVSVPVGAGGQLNATHGFGVVVGAGVGVVVGGAGVVGFKHLWYKQVSFDPLILVMKFSTKLRVADASFCWACIF